MKAMPLGYNRDTQEDKPPLFDSLALTFDSIRLVHRMIETAEWRTARMADSVHGDFSTATDLANYLAETGMPFREAHEVVGRVVRACQARDMVLEDLTIETLREIAPEGLRRGRWTYSRRKARYDGASLWGARVRRRWRRRSRTRVGCSASKVSSGWPRASRLRQSGMTQAGRLGHNRP